jgi:hypothetical protein
MKIEEEINSYSTMKPANQRKLQKHLDQGKLKVQGSLEELRSLPGEHLDFLTP